MTDRLITDLCKELQPLAQQFIDNCKTAGINAFIDQTYRGEDDQNADYASGRTAPGHIITNAQYGQSPHNCTNPDGSPGARAFDFGIIGQNGVCDWNPCDDQWQKAIKIGEALGLISGSTWHTIVDNPHFELPNWQENKTGAIK